MLNELKFFDIPEKKFYTQKEINELAERNADDYKNNKRKFLSKLGHLLGSQQTAIDMVTDLKNELKKDLKNIDVLEKAASYVQFMLKAKFCDLIVSIKTNEYKELYENIKADYLEVVRDFVQGQYSKDITDMLINHLTDALEVLIENGDTTAEIKLKNLEKVSDLVNCYKTLELKLKKLQKNFQPQILDECKLKYDEIFFHRTDAKVALLERIDHLLQKLFTSVTKDIHDDIEKESNSKSPAITKLLQLFSQYEEIAAQFKGFEFEIPQYGYERKKTELTELHYRCQKDIDEFSQKFENIKNINNKLQAYIKSEELLVAVSYTVSNMNYSYLEIIQAKKKLISLQDLLVKFYAEKKNNILSPLKKNISPDKQLTPPRQFQTWNSSLNELQSLKTKLSSHHCQTDDITNLIAEIILNQNRYALKLCQRYNYKAGSLKEHLNIYKLALRNLENNNDAYETLSREYDEITEFQNNFHKNIHSANKYAALVTQPDCAAEPGKIFAAYSKLETIIKSYQDSKMLVYPEINSAYQNIIQEYDIASANIQSYKNKIAWQGTISLIEPETNTRLVIFTSSQITIGRADKQGALAQHNQILIPWKRLSAQHLMIDFEKGFLKDLKSSHGTYINKKGTDDDRIERVYFNEVKEFNLAKDITFSLFHVPDNFKGFHCLGLSTKHDNSCDHVSIKALDHNLRNTWFIYLPPNRPLFIRKFDGQPAYQNSNPDRNYQIIYKNGFLFFSDFSKGIDDHLILRHIDDVITMKIE
jgi:hypothetical protein